VVVDVDSSVLVAAGAGAGVVTLVVVEVVSFSLLQPANNANVIKPVAISALFFIIEFSFLKFYLGYLPNKFKPTIMLTQKGLLFPIKQSLFGWVVLSPFKGCKHCIFRLNFS
jgi:hypothetical protein